MIRLTASKELLLKHPYLETMIMNVGLLSVIFSTKSVTQNHRKGISFSRMTLFGAFLSWHLRYYFNIKQGCEVVHHAALPSSACVAYRMNFNDNFDIWWGQRKLFQEDAINWSQPGADCAKQKFITWPSDASFEISECIQSHATGDTETRGFRGKSNTIFASLKHTERSKWRALSNPCQKNPAESLRD